MATPLGSTAISPQVPHGFGSSLMALYFPWLLRWPVRRPHYGKKDYEPEKKKRARPAEKYKHFAHVTLPVAVRSPKEQTQNPPSGQDVGSGEQPNRPPEQKSFFHRVTYRLSRYTAAGSVLLITY